MKYGQFIYNYTTSEGKTYCNLNGVNLEEKYITSVEDSEGLIGKDLVLLTEQPYWLGVAIQAPYGTKFIINDTTVIIGPNGIYDYGDYQIYAFIFPEENDNKDNVKNNIIIDYRY